MELNVTASLALSVCVCVCTCTCVNVCSLMHSPTALLSRGTAPREAQSRDCHRLLPEVMFTVYLSV